MEKSSARRPTRAIAIAAAAMLTLVLAGPIEQASASAPASTADRGTAPTAGRTTGMRGPCLGGGKMSVVVAQPSGGGLSVHVATQGLRNGSRWFGHVTVVDLDGVADSQHAAIPSTQTVSGGFTLDIDFDAVARPSVTASLQAHPDERCRSSVDTTTAAVATCHGGLRVSISAVQTRNPDRLAMVARIRGAHPGSLWSNWTSWRSKPETGGSGGEYEASESGLVEVRITFVGGYLPNRTFSTTFDGPSGQHCSLQLGTHRLASKA